MPVVADHLHGQAEAVCLSAHVFRLPVKRGVGARRANRITAYSSDVQELCERMDVEAVKMLINPLYEAYERGRREFLFGNGRSAANVSHFCEDVAKGK